MLGPFSLTHGRPGLRTPGQKPRVVPAKASVVSGSLSYFPITQHMWEPHAPGRPQTLQPGPVRLPESLTSLGACLGNGSFQIPESKPLALYQTKEV